jgi:hypothetical protein
MGRRFSQIKADKAFLAGKVQTQGLFVNVRIPKIQKICANLRPIFFLAFIQRSNFFFKSVSLLEDPKCS